MGWKEDLFTWVIRTFAGKYLKDIETDQLRISLYSGEASIENMSLRDDVIEALMGWPVRVKQSNVSSIRIKIPSWTSITSVHVELCVEDIFAVVVPKENHFKVQDADRYNEKMRQVAFYEANGEAQREAPENISSDGSSNNTNGDGKYNANDSGGGMSWYQRIGLTVLNNAVIKVKNVHLRYEDFMEASRKPWAFGVVIKDIELISTNSNWEEAIVQHDPNSPQFKVKNKTKQNKTTTTAKKHYHFITFFVQMGKIDSFSLYWDHNIEDSKVSSITDRKLFNSTMLEMVTLQTPPFHFNYLHLFKP